jgi:hypothetical protein
VIDIDNDNIKNHFSNEDWEVLTRETNPGPSIEDEDILNILEHLKSLDTKKVIMKALLKSHPRLGENYEHIQDFDVKWIFDSVSKWYEIIHIK